MVTNDSKKKVLLFESDDDSRTLLKDAFTEIGYSVEEISGGLEGINVAEYFPVNLVVANMDYPGLSGLEILEWIKGKNLNTQVIITGDSSEETILRAFREGASDFIKKPFSKDIVKERITDILSKIIKIADGDVTAKDDTQKILENLERKNKELNNLLKISSSFKLPGNTKKVMLNRLTELAAESMNCEAASILLINNRDKVLEFVVATGEKMQRLSTISVPVGEGIAGWVAVHGEPQIVNDTSKDKRFTGNVDAESGFVTRQILAIPLLMDEKIIGVLEIINTRDNRILGEDDLRAITALGERAATVIETSRTITDQQNFYVQTTNILVNAVEKRDIFNEGHPWKVAELCHKIAAIINLPDIERNDLHFGSLLHDIGKLDMPSTLFNKRNLSERELEFIRQHPVKGAKLLDPITMWHGVVPLVLYHHEAWDGSGYPFGRSGDSAPLGARIISIAEAFTVMRSPNSYKKQMSLKETILEIMRLSGKQFDPDIVKALISVLEKESISV
jgi:response regulator RpfG family c-di-GMP phosphodiesterase